ncbi:MAG TPA: class I SAM-dependent methyltransferase [Pyrinomonadaceae bacterium]|nr:class I SAM-dependent methyltransferase [Pyrinomonadaceae bacterium]
MSPSYFGKPRSVVSAELKPIEEVDCPLCHLAPKPFAVDYQGSQLCQCQSCGLQFVSPRPTFDQMSAGVYTDSYLSDHDYAAQHNKVDSYNFARQLSNYEHLLGRRGKILDVGCGNGSFLHYAQTQGWEIFGTDIRVSPAAKRLRCPLWEGQLQETDFGSARFDVVRFNHVIEHIQNPLDALTRTRDLLKPEGILYTSVPNITGLSSRLKSLQCRLGLKQHRWRHYAALHHLFFFSPQTLRLVIESAGLRVLLWETPVLKKSRQHALVEVLYRYLLERSNSASILDFYCALA